MNQSSEKIFIDPSYPVFNQDKLFDLGDPLLNRDDQLRPFYRLREDLCAKGKSVHTADYLFSRDAERNTGSAYYSLGILENYQRIAREERAKLKAFVIMEPPVVAPSIYKALPELTCAFERVYVHNVEGDGYDLDGVCRDKLRRLYWPLPYANVLEPYWSQQSRSKRIVVINGSHKPRSFNGEQYSTRIEAMVALAKYDAVDLFGRGWERWWSREAQWMPYWSNRLKLMSIYKGACTSKFEVLQRYQFCLCFENMVMNGYVTEKIFDCLYAGTIPLYLGALDILKYVPEDTFIDCRRFQTWDEMWDELRSMSENQIKAMQEAGREFFKSDQAQKFVNSLANLVQESDE